MPELPEDFLQLTSLLLLREREQNYPSFKRRYYSDDREIPLEKREEILIESLIKIIKHITNRLPPGISAPNRNLLTTSIYELAGIDDHFCRLLLDFYGYFDPDSKHLNDEVKHIGKPYERLSPLWKDLLQYRFAVTIPDERRFQHTHVIAVPGTGKTTLLKQLILEDIQKDATVIVMTPKGDLIPSLEKLRDIPEERLVIIRPDQRHPLALNVFDLKGRARSVTIELINSIFSAGLDAKTTAKQAPLLDHCISLMLEVPNATIHTLYHLIRADKLPKEYEPYLPRLNQVGQEFMLTQFSNKKVYGETKEQIGWRLDALRKNEIITAMFSSTETLFNMGEEIEQGKVILIDTSEASLGEGGSAFFGRFFLTLLRLAFPQRDIKTKLKPVFVYIDEAGNYLDDSSGAFFERSREARVALTVAHQFLSQLSPKLESAVHGTALKFIGRCNDEDAAKMGRIAGLDYAAVHNLPNFNFYVRGLTKSSFKIETREDLMRRLPQRTSAEVETLRRENWGRYTQPRYPQPRPYVLKVAEDAPPDDIEVLNKR